MRYTTEELLFFMVVSASLINFGIPFVTTYAMQNFSYFAFIYMQQWSFQLLTSMRRSGFLQSLISCDALFRLGRKRYLWCPVVINILGWLIQNFSRLPNSKVLTQLDDTQVVVTARIEFEGHRSFFNELTQSWRGWWSSFGADFRVCFFPHI